MVSKTRIGTCSVACVLVLLLIIPMAVNIDSMSQAQIIDDRLLSAYVFMNTSCVDFTNDGHFNEHDRFGTPTTWAKRLKTESKIIRGTLNYYNYTLDPDALSHAIDTYYTIEANMRNPSHTYNPRMAEDWSSAIISNSRTIDNSFYIRALVDLYEHTGNQTYYQTAVWLLSFITYFHRNFAYGGYHIEVDEFGTPNYYYYPYGKLPGYVALAAGSLLSVEPTNTSFLDELNYALNFAYREYWDFIYGGYCYGYTPQGAIYESRKTLWFQSIMMTAFHTGYIYTGNTHYRNHSIEIADFIIKHFTDSSSGLLSEVTRDLFVLNSIRNSGALANTASALLDMYILTGNVTYLYYGWNAINFVKQYHYDSNYLGFFKWCAASGTPVDTEKWSEFQYDILLAFTRYDPNEYPPPTTTDPPPTTTTPTTPTTPSFDLLLPLTIIGGTIIVVQVIILAIILIQRKEKPVKYSQLISSGDSSKPKGIQFCTICGSQIKPNDRFCAGCGKEV